MPNLAMMKISAYHKARGDTVSFLEPDPDLVYVSRIFKKNKFTPPLYPNAKILQGGPGFDVSIRLPPEIESTAPDQDLYDSKYSIARVTSGCPRRCHFCMVHALEGGGVRYILPPEAQWKPGTTLRLLDDNILAMPEAFWEVFEFSMKNKAKVHFEYFDIRLMTKEVAKALRKMKVDRPIYFAFDYSAIEDSVLEGFQIMVDAGWPRGDLNFYLYWENEKMTVDVRKRFEIIRDLGGIPFLMADVDTKTEAMIRIARKANNKLFARQATVDEIFDPITTIEQLVKKHKEELK